MKKKLFAGIRSKLFGKIVFSFLLILLVWMIAFWVGTQIVLVRAFNFHYEQLAENPPADLEQELQSDQGLFWMGPRQNAGGEERGGGQRLFGVRLLEEVRSLVRKSVNTSLGFATLAAFVVAIIASLIIGRQLVQPAQEMSNAAQRIADGHYSERVSLPADVKPHDYDEWQDFAHQFNLMAQSLEETETMRRQLIGDVAHEMRTPLTTIKGYIEGLQDGVVNADDETFTRIHDEAARLQHLVNDLQELSQVESNSVPMELTPLSSLEMVETIRDRLGLLFDEKQIHFQTDMPADLPAILADKERMQQVLLNLVNNAWNYTPEGGTVTLAAWKEPEKVHFVVTDNGIGLAEEHLKHIFDRFYRVDKSRSRNSGGSGIGLTISKRLVEAMGGDIWAESEGEGKGSQFHFRLPTA